MTGRNILLLCILAVITAGGAVYWLLPEPQQPGPFGPDPESAAQSLDQGEPPCPDARPEWRAKQVIEGVTLEESPDCTPDNPHAVAAFVKGTNHVGMHTLMQSGLSTDALVLENDRDGDGDPDDIHIRLEVAELNGHSPDVDFPIPIYTIAPGIQPGFWVFTPKLNGMATYNFGSYEASPLLRPPSPTIRVEAGDRVKITLENTHYLPHTIHLHGVDHRYYLDHPMHDGQRGNDGVSETSHIPVMPGEVFTYEITPRQPGTQLYHCHEQAPIHVGMGLMGIFVVEENRPDNWVQTLNVGAGRVRHPSVAVKETYWAEYDLIYQEVDKELNELITQSNDPRRIGLLTTRGYDVTQAKPEYFLLNGRSFPYTLRESLVVVEPDRKVKIRMANGGSDEGIAIHSHGHKPTITHYDGVPHNPLAWVQRDVFDLDPAQRYDLELDTVDDGLHSFGPGVWMMHDHREKATTSHGQFPGGNITLIVYRSFLGENGLPAMHGMDLAPYFTPTFYERKVPVWQAIDPSGSLADPAPESPSLTGPLLLFFAAGLGAGGLVLLVLFRRRGRGEPD
ncbi:MAG: multicopper oxidase domain-containing protein [Methylococcaceae bacterium]|nr:multicopper oxidase domain-containing protein [Methylococcaceae bacterium]